MGFDFPVVDLASFFIVYASCCADLSIGAVGLASAPTTAFHTP